MKVQRLVPLDARWVDWSDIRDLITAVYARCTGDIWVYGSDLRVLTDIHPDGPFRHLYEETLDDSFYRDKVHSVRFVLGSTDYDILTGNIQNGKDEEEAKRLRKQLVANLNRLTLARVSTIHVARQDEVDKRTLCVDVPPTADEYKSFHKHAWIVLTDTAETGSSGSGSVAICRFKNDYPFEKADKKGDGAEIVAASWSVPDARRVSRCASAARRVLSRRVIEYLSLCFDDLEFYALEPTIGPGGQIEDVTLVSRRSRDKLKEIHALAASLEDARRGIKTGLKTFSELLSEVPKPFEASTEVLHNPAEHSDEHTKIIRRYLDWYDVGIITALEDERAALVAELRRIQKEGGRCTVWEDGLYTFAMYRSDQTNAIHHIVIRCVGDYGSVLSGIAAAAMIRDFSPTNLVLCGYAAGRGPEETDENGNPVPRAMLCGANHTTKCGSNGPTYKSKQDLLFGDVVVSSRILPYHYGKIHGISGADHTWKRELGRPIPANGPVLRAAQRLLADRKLSQQESETTPQMWKPWVSWADNCLKMPWPKCESCGEVLENSDNWRTPFVWEGVVACGSMVLTAYEVVRWLVDSDRKIQAVEMEAEGVGAAAAMATGEGLTTSFVVIKGVVDYADPKKGDAWHTYGAASAARFVIECLRWMAE